MRKKMMLLVGSILLGLAVAGLNMSFRQHKPTASVKTLSKEHTLPKTENKIVLPEKLVGLGQVKIESVKQASSIKISQSQTEIVAIIDKSLETLKKNSRMFNYRKLERTAFQSLEGNLRARKILERMVTDQRFNSSYFGSNADDASEFATRFIAYLYKNGEREPLVRSTKLLVSSIQSNRLSDKRSNRNLETLLIPYIKAQGIDRLIHNFEDISEEIGLDLSRDSYESSSPISKPVLSAMVLALRDKLPYEQLQVLLGDLFPSTRNGDLRNG